MFYSDISLASGKYNRKHWKHWIDEDKDCQNTRQEILIDRSLTPVQLNKKGCTVKSGKWMDYYYPEVHTNASLVDIDHLVPLMNAHQTGGALWTRKLKEQFANDPENLVVTDRKYNRAKGPKGIDAWLPINREYACKYIRDWVKVKKKYNLVLTEKEAHTVKVSNCPL
jgi:hypothetical protein